MKYFIGITLGLFLSFGSVAAAKTIANLKNQDVQASSTKIFFVDNKYVIRFNDGIATCYVYNYQAANSTMSCVK